MGEISSLPHGAHNKGLIRLSCKERPHGSQLPCGQDNYFNPYPHHYSMAFAFSMILYPHSQQFPLRLTCPNGQEYGLTVFHMSDIEWFRPYLCAGNFTSAYPQQLQE